jgi:hypothetical protein
MATAGVVPAQELEPPSCHSLLGTILGAVQADPLECTARGGGLIAVIEHAGGVYRIQIDHLPAGHDRRREERR